MTDMVTCPLCEDYEGTRGQVIAHASSKVDEDHKGVGGQQMKAMLDADEAVGGPSETSETPSENPDGQQQTTEAASGTDGSTDPTSQTPPSETSQTSTGNPDGTDEDPAREQAEAGCDQCGGELVDTRDSNYLRTETGRHEPAPGDFYCSQCGLEHNYTPDE